MSLWGEFTCPTWSYEEIRWYTILPFSTPKVRAIKRIGPHNKDILSVLIGSLLGDASAEKHGEGTRFCFQQEHSNRGYLLWFHSFVSDLGYCNPNTPHILTRLGANGKIRQLSRFKTFTYTSFNWILDFFYISVESQRIKIVPAIIEDYLTPLALAVWIMDDGGAVSYGVKLATNSFTLQEVELLCNIINHKYRIAARPVSAGVPNQHLIYIPASSLLTLANIVGPHLHPSMYYKLNYHL